MASNQDLPGPRSIFKRGFFKCAGHFLKIE